MPYAPRVRVTLVCAATALLAAACIHIPPKPIEPETTARDLESRSLADARLKHSGTSWTLDDLTRAALLFHPDLDVARAEAAVARAAIATAAERPNPNASLPIEHKSEVHPWITVLDVDFTIETANKRGLRVRHAEDLTRAADLTIAQDAWQIRSAIRQQLVALTTADESSAILARQRDIQNDLVEALQKRFELGEGSQIELTQARISARQTDLLLRDRQGAVTTARARLAAAVGVPQAGLGDATFAFDPHKFPYPNLADLREQALRARPDILVSLANYAAAESDLRLELARQYPDLHIAPGFGWDQGAARWDLGFASIAPIFSRNRGAIGEAEARRSAAESRFVALQARVIGSIEIASAQYDSALKKLNAAESAFQLQRTQTDRIEAQFKAGQIDRVALRTAELELVSAELARADATAQAQDALGAIEDALEQPLESR
ncbi:MAG TPA: TolC family protein [Thermoanaerobaculia bacterium]|nr:TolC family protein [Thermoanaerobaculia bacterium]